jgi:formiminotetrahydrofolate cyclodeaminase
MCLGISARKFRGLAAKAADTEAGEMAASLERLDGEAAAVFPAFRELETRDEAAFTGFLAAFRLPRASEEEDRRRRAAVEGAAREATGVPLELEARILLVLELAARASETASGRELPASSDLLAAVELGRAAFQVATLNVAENLHYLVEEDRAEFRARATDLTREFEALGPRLEALFLRRRPRPE